MRGRAIGGDHNVKRAIRRNKHALAATVRASALACAAAASPVLAMDLNPGGDWAIRWDNTVRYSVATRIQGQDAALLANPNGDDGDRNFKKGLISNRADLLSEFDAQRNGFGIRLSGAAWYDSVYNRTNDNDSAFTVNHGSVPYNEFTSGTRDIAGRHAEMLDYFVFGRWDLGSTTLSARLGQHSLIWGTSLFFGANGIAKGMEPVDVYKLSIPGTVAKETTIPVKQLSSTWQVADSTSIEGYVQFQYKETRLHPAGSYLSNTDMLGDGRERLFIGAPSASKCGPPRTFVNCYVDYAGLDDSSKIHNYGFALNQRVDALQSDVGLYAIRYSDNSPYISTNVPGGSFQLVVPSRPVTAVGASLSTWVGDANLGIEASVRQHQQLVAKQGVISPGDPAYPLGRTAHLNISWTMLMPKAAFWDGSALVGEFAANKVLSQEDVRTVIPGAVPAGTSKVDDTRAKQSSGIRVIFTPSWYQVAPGWDMSMPINVGYSFRGISMIDQAFPFGGSPTKSGDANLGITGTYLSKYIVNLTYTNFFGKPADNPIADRDYIRLSVQTTF